MKINFNIQSFNIKTIFNIKIIFFILIIFISLFLFQLDLINVLNLNYLSEYIFYCFYGVNSLLENIISLFSWSIFQLFIIILIVNYLNSEFNGRNVYIISKLGNKKSWLLNLELTIFLSIIIYFIIGFLAIIICSVISNKSIIFATNLIDPIFIFIILCLNSYLYINLYVLVLLKSNNSNISFLFIIIILFASIDLGSMFNFDLYNPFTQSIMIKHAINNIPFYHSISLLLIVDILLLLYLYINIIKIDLYNIST